MIGSRSGSSPFEGLDTNSMKRPWNNRLIYTFFLPISRSSSSCRWVFFSIREICYVISILPRSATVMEQKTRLLARQLPWSDEPGSLDSICRTSQTNLGCA